eukprot:gene3384-13423_t
MMRNRKSARPLIVLLVLMAIGFFIWMFMGQRPSTTSCPLAPADMYSVVSIYSEHISCIVRINSEHINGVVRIYSEHVSSVVRIYSEHVSSVVRINSEHVSSVVRINSEHVSSVARINSEHDHSVVRINSEHDHRVVRINSEHDRSAVSIYSEHVDSVVRIYSEHVSSVVRINSERDHSVVRINSEHDHSVVRIYSEHDHSVVRIYSEHAAVLGSSNYQNFYEQICGGDKCSGIALDVGAFTGTHSWFMAKAGFQVHAFEIYPVSFEILQCNAQLASHLFSGSPIKVTQQGVSSAIGTECLMQPLTSNPKASMLLGKNMKERIHFLKLDLEGHEQAALQGAAKMLKEAPPPYILMSYRHHVNTMKQVDMKEMLKMIYSVGYRVFDCDIQVEVKQGDSGIRLLGNYATSQKGTQLLLVLAPADDQSDLPRFMCSSAPE